MENQLSLFTLNCWGLKYVSKHRSERILGIANILAKSTYDIVALQELWVYKDFELVRDSVAQYLPYSKFFYSGALGAGLALFSRFPIISASVHPYSLNGAPIDVSAGDWFVGKAAASIVIHHPLLNEVQIFNTHLFAKGGDDGPEHSRAHRLVNAWELAKLVCQAAELGRYVIAPGDYNSIPTTLPITLIKDYAALSDAWSVTHPNTPSSTPRLVPSSTGAGSMPDTTTPISPALQAIRKYGVTADSPLNSFSAQKSLDPHARQFYGKRLDYVFFRQPARPHPSSSMPLLVLRCIECKVVMTEYVPKYDFSYSDHFGLEAKFEIVSAEGDGDGTAPLPARDAGLSRASISTAIQALMACYRFSTQRSRKELMMFMLCIFILPAITIGTAWLPHPWINPIFILFTVFISWLGTTMLYEGFLYGNWERNALMNIIEELEIYQKQIDAQSRIPRNSVNN